jgi:lipopolysaccharide export system permease protein
VRIDRSGLVAELENCSPSRYIALVFILWRHILRAHAAPFFFSIVVLMAIFVLQFIMKFMDKLVGKGLSAGVIVEMIVLNLAWMVVLAVPMSVLIAALMAFGGLASTNEITAMRASGVSLYRMMAPALVGSVVVCLLLVVFNNDVLPDANYKAKILTNDIYRKKPTLSITPGLFSSDITGYTILVRKTFEESNDLEGITIFDRTQPNVSTTVTAEHGTISFSPDYRKLIMDLYDGEIHEISIPDYSQYRWIKFQKHRIAMNADGFDFQRSQESAFLRGDRELSAHDMIAKVDSLDRIRQKALSAAQAAVGTEITKLFAPGTPIPEISRKGADATVGAGTRITALQNTLKGHLLNLDYLERREREYRVEIHKKYAIPVAAMIFVLIGAPLGIMARRGTFGMAASLSLGFFLLYWAFLIGGEKLADRGFFHPWIGMWAANILLGVLGAYLTLRTARESLTIDWSRFRKLVPKHWRISDEHEDEVQP